mgnify:CR=1 FL=1
MHEFEHNFLWNSPVQFWVNKIHTWIMDESKIREACMQEIKRRIERYIQEVSTGNEKKETVLRTEQIYSLFNYEKLLW